MAEDGKIPGSGQTAEDPKIQDLARRMMDLWQEQMAAIAADPDLMRQMARMMAASPFPAMMQGIMQGILAATAKPGEGAANPYEWWKADGNWNPGAAKPSAPPPTGPAPAAPASQPGGGDLAELRRHLAGLEARLAELGGGAKPESEPSKPKPKRPARKPQKPVAGPAGGGGESGAGGADGGAAG